MKKEPSSASHKNTAHTIDLMKSIGGHVLAGLGEKVEHKKYWFTSRKIAKSCQTKPYCR